MKLQTKLVGSITGLAVLITLIPGSWMVWKTYGALRTQAQQGQLALARNLAAQVDQGMSQVVQTLDVLALRPDMVRMERKALLQALSLVTSTTQLFEALVVVEPNGRIQGLKPGETEKLPPVRATREVYAQAQAAREPVLSEVYETKDGDLAASLNVPIFRRGKMVGMLMGVMLLSNLGVEDLEEIRIGQSGFAYLVNEKGQAIVHPAPAKLLADGQATTAISRLLAQEDGVAEFSNAEGKGLLAAYARVESVSWGMVVLQPSAECYAPAERLLRFLLASLAAVVAGSAILGLFLARHLFRPLLALTGEVRRFESGTLDPGPLEKLGGKDEIGTVALALARMARALKAQQLERERAHARVLATEKKLAESERLAVLGQLSAGLAHELNNPLAVILGSAREAQAAPGTAAVPWLDRVEREARRCQRLVKDLLDFARPIRLRKRRTLLAPLYQQAFNQALLGRESRYKLALSGGPGAAHVDADRFKQVFINLFSNSLDAMPLGGELAVKTREIPRGLLISVRDHGQGLPKGDPQTLFRPFFTTKAAGTGLGLAICRSIVKAHGGEILAQRPRGKGAAFLIQLPLKAGSE